MTVHDLVNARRDDPKNCPDLLGADGWRWRVLRTSNAYHFRDAGAADPMARQGEASKSEKPTGTPNQEFFPLLATPAAAEPKRAFEDEAATLRLMDGPIWRKTRQ